MLHLMPLNLFMGTIAESTITQSINRQSSISNPKPLNLFMGSIYNLQSAIYNSLTFFHFSVFALNITMMEMMAWGYKQWESPAMGPRHQIIIGNQPNYLRII